MISELPEITQNSLARAQQAVHWTNTTLLPQANSRDSPGKLWTRALMWTLHGDTIPLRTARERMQSAAHHCHKH